MIGAIAGDIIGSTYEFNKTKDYNFDLFPPDSDFTDDSVLSLAIAMAILEGSDDYEVYIRTFAENYPDRGYGGMFKEWVKHSKTGPYNSFGNGSAMRVSAIGCAFDSEEEVLEEAKKTAECTHNHPEGIKGAQATALAIWLAKKFGSKGMIKSTIERQFNYNLDTPYEIIQPVYTFNETCQGTVPEAIICFLESTDYEDCIRKAISMGGDADTIACIAGGIAEAFYGDVPEEIKDMVLNKLDTELKLILCQFEISYETD